ncbi:MAG TPA: hypothetical protein VMI94_00020 [Bryobacteraceae bacterium]|nr:hypothetical protein [Bryobacteraceae bacterium]
MERSLSELEALVRNRICGVCTDRKPDGTCGLDRPVECALFRLFPQVAEAIQSTHSDRMEDYIDAIRLKVCSVCQTQDQYGDCTARQEVQCALDAYLLLVVEAIEEATGRDFGRPLPGSGNQGPVRVQI